MPHRFKPGQAWRGPGPGEWVVEAVFEGLTVVGAAMERTTEGVVHLRNQELGYRAITPVGDKRLQKLKRV